MTSRAPSPRVRTSRASTPQRHRTRGAWAGSRWWAPGTVVAATSGLVGWLATEAWHSYEAGGCGNPGAKFACLGESLVAGALAVVLGPVAVWLAYRRAGVPRAFPGLLVAAAVGFCLLAAVELVAQVGVLSGRERIFQAPPGAVVGGVVGLAVLGGGLAWAGPRRAARAGLAAGSLGVLVTTVLLLQGPVERASTRLELARVEVPLVVPAGWLVSRPHVGGDGSLSYDAIPAGWDGDGFGGVDVDVTGPDRHLDTCDHRPCVVKDDVTVELSEPGDPSQTAWRVLDGPVPAVVTVRTYGDRGPDVDLADLLRSMEPVTVDEVVDRLHRP